MKIKKYVALLGMLLMLVSLSTGTFTTAEASIVKVIDLGSAEAPDVGIYLDTDSIRVYPGNSRYEALVSDLPDFRNPSWKVFVKSPSFPALYSHSITYEVWLFDNGFYAQSQGINDIKDLSDKKVLEQQPGSFVYAVDQNTICDDASLDKRFFGSNENCYHIDIADSALLGAIIASHNGQSVRCRTITSVWDDDIFGFINTLH